MNDLEKQLLKAATQGDAAAVRALLAQGVNPNAGEYASA